MNRLLRLLPVGAVLTGLIATTGCMDHTFTDPCWPDRYSHQARSLVVANYEPQIANGHTLDQTIWNEHFERGTDKLNLSGQDKVDQLVRRRPHPDAKVYLATARDITYDPAKPEEYVKAVRTSTANAKRPFGIIGMLRLLVAPSRSKLWCMILPTPIFVGPLRV